MITSIFSIFDPSSSLIRLKLNWASFILIRLIIPSYFWLISSPYKIINNNINKLRYNSFKPRIRAYSHFNSYIFIPIFILIILNNIIGLFPYIFTATRHIIITFRIALSLWISFTLFGWIVNTKIILSHIVPSGTPFRLMFFIVIIETVRRLVRPLTLAIRLIANITAGHLLIHLLRSLLTFIKITSFIAFLRQTILIILETAVAIIQAYVFAILITLYIGESK